MDKHFRQTLIVCAWTEPHNLPENSMSLERECSRSYLAHYLSQFLFPHKVIWSGKPLFKMGLQSNVKQLKAIFFIPFPMVICTWGLCCLVLSGHKCWGRTEMMSAGEDTWSNTSRHFWYQEAEMLDGSDRFQKEDIRFQETCHQNLLKKALTHNGEHSASIKFSSSS